MMNYSNEILQAAYEVRTTAGTVIAPAILDEMVSQVEEKCRSLQPGIMLYGFYNAGKSTLLNALLGQDVAATSDLPETKCITEYNYRGCRIFDSPGLDAPVEHEKLSRVHLAKVEVVIFVISSSGVPEERASYSEIAGLLESKQVIVVMNDKDCLDEEELLDKQKNINLQLLKLFPEQCRNITLICVNAKSALNGRKAGKNLLLARSNIGRLEEEIAQRMARTTVFDSVRTAARLITPLIDQAEEALQKMAPQDADSIARLRVSSRTEQRLHRLRTGGLDLISRECQSAIQKMRESMSQIQEFDNDLFQEIATKCDACIRDGLKGLLDEFISEVEEELGGVISVQAGDLNIKDLRPGQGIDAAVPAAESGRNGFSDALREVNPGMVKNIGFKTARVIGKLANKVSNETLKKVLISAGKLAKGAGRLAGTIAPLLQVAIGIFEIKNGHDEDQAAFEAKKAQVHALNQALEQIQYSMKSEYEGAWRTTCDATQNQIDTCLAGLKERDNANSAELRQRLDQLGRIRNRLEELSTQR